MKRPLLLLVLTTLWVGCLFATPRSVQQAKEVASQYFTAPSGGNSVRKASPVPMTLSWTARQTDGTPAFYVFNRGLNQGFVIISADDNAREVLGYSRTGHFDATNMPEHIRSWFTMYQEEIRHAATLSPSRRMARAKETAHTYSPVGPLCTTQWGQGNPYNLLCPTDSGGRCVTGCVATAAAQIMKFHNYPTRGIGSHSYTWTDIEGNETVLTADFGNTTYQWNQMQNSYTGTTTSAQKNAVATLMRDCGISCNMAYTYRESGAITSQMLRAMVEHFGYDAGIKMFQKDYMEENAFIDSINVDLQAGRPVYFNGRTVRDEGHAFVCDGIDAAGMVHINWGWYGSCDGYFRVSALDPEDQGIGGSSGNYAYTESVSAYTNIKPNAGGQATFTMICEGADVWQSEISKENDWLCLHMTHFSNNNPLNWTGHPSLIVYQNGSVYTTYIDETESSLSSGYYYHDFYSCGYFGELPAGEYEIAPAITPSAESTTCIPVLLKGVGAFRFPMTVTADSIFVRNPYVEEDTSSAPTPAVLSQYYDITNNVVLCTRFMDAPCFDVYFVGTPTNWASSFTNCPKFEPLPGYDGWYAVAVPYTNGIEGKPIQANADGSFSWENQTGDMYAWQDLGGSGCKHATITSGFSGEANITYPSAGCYVYQVDYWKNHMNTPCDNLPQRNYTICVYAPNACADMKPSIIGTFNNWAAGVPMTEIPSGDRILYTCTIRDNGRGEIKFREVNDTDWSNEILVYDQNANEWYAMSNIQLPIAQSDTMLFFDFSDNAKYRFTQCNTISGVCGDHLTWILDEENGILTISGYGDMYDYDQCPWSSYRDSIISIILPEGMTRIGNRAFHHLRYAQTINIPSTVTSIGNYAFYGCAYLPSVNISASIETIGSGAFGGCYSVSAIQVANANPNYCAIDGVLFSKDGADLVQYPAGKAGNSYTIPAVTTYIGTSAFGGCYNLETVIIPDNVTMISHYAFEYSGITSITIPKNLEAIGAYAFEGCNLTEVTWNAINCPTFISDGYFYPVFDYAQDNISSFTFGEEVQVIPVGLCYAMPNLTSVTIPQSVTTIDFFAFGYCYGLTDITCHAAVPPTCGDEVFYDLNVATIPLYVPAASMGLYQEADTWEDFLIQAISPTAIENAGEDAHSAYKKLHNGQIYIIRNGETYTEDGKLVNGNW